jgi:hypothetical protein
MSSQIVVLIYILESVTSQHNLIINTFLSFEILLPLHVYSIFKLIRFIYNSSLFYNKEMWA